ncbi:4-(cytidine 5'-diphospho)-2-C-methyl-D-erythritol kinase [Guyparkeria halophila]|uniref:4-diphosphocytidyl-2-C-methyl-D-erythritol kinase n=1 Tax=Guyparkeria halophila TaxID=47960 RepID=A0ABZ0YTB8_9GAMM|nr:4-(cytidine 5'-diphospho)-2-C-methyl-D-erythritol kinase [Guyparkeria halophila]WQH15418.1 4-(cytidine 5'-diphospho)-2-C-methyl-D-erythritol kinase [Guyparkeria halophila]
MGYRAVTLTTHAPHIEPAAEAHWLRAGCKLNLYLHINARRADGYHELQTFFELLEYGDELRVDTDHDDIRIDWVAGDEPITGQPTAPQEDLLYRAAIRLREQARDDRRGDQTTPHGAHVTLRKHVPVGGGLGGGSAAAARLLRVLNRAWGLDYPIDTLARIGKELGADVPVFVHGHSATAHGIGEQLHPDVAHDTSGIYLVLVPRLSSPTAALFASERLERSLPKQPDAELLDRWRDKGQNVFEPRVLEQHPELAALLSDLKTEAGFARMTGSGACLFAPVASERDGQRIGDRLASRHEILRRYFVSSRVDHAKSVR